MSAWKCLIPLVWLLLSSSSSANEEGKLVFEGVTFRTYQVDPSKEQLHLLWKDAKGNPYNNLRGVQVAKAAEDKEIQFITNAGIYEKAPGINQGYQPLGLHVEDGKQLIPLNINPGKGNFFLEPNGVFFIDAHGKARILNTGRYAAAPRKPQLACQSGPMLVEAGKIHPRFNADGPSKRLRNGVGVNSDGMIVFAICASGEVVNFHTFARLFKDQLDCPDALFLDGDICKMAVNPGDTAVDPSGVFAAMFAVLKDKGHDGDGLRQSARSSP